MILSKKTHCFSCRDGELLDFGFIHPIRPGFERQLSGCQLCGATKETWLGKLFKKDTGAGVVIYKR